jgi:hypothetical protein
MSTQIATTDADGSTNAAAAENRVWEYEKIPDAYAPDPCNVGHRLMKLSDDIATGKLFREPELMRQAEREYPAVLSAALALAAMTPEQRLGKQSAPERRGSAEPRRSGKARDKSAREG